MRGKPGELPVVARGLKTGQGIEIFFEIISPGLNRFDSGDRGDEDGGLQHGGGFDACGEARDGEDGDVVVLTEGDGGFAGLPGVGPGGEELLEAIEAEDFSGGAAGFEQAVGVEGETVSDFELDGGLVVAGGGDESEGEFGRKMELVLVEVGREVASVGEGAEAVGVEPEDEAGDEAVLHAAVDAAVEAGEDLGWVVVYLGE